MKTLNVIGCGKVGRTLSRLGIDHGVWRVRDVLNRSLASARRAVEFLGSGRPLADCGQLSRADLVMISAADEAIEPCCRKLCATETIGPNVIVFHCSGSLPSGLLKAARQRGASIASIHPVKSFADPAAAVETFAGTFCAVEGDAPACRLLRDALQRCGGIPFQVQPEFKTIYHAATVIVCNYLVALVEVGLRCFEKAGIPRATATEVLEPIVTDTAENVFRLGPVRALTGPIARGEASVVARQCEALGRWDRDIQRLYKGLGRVAVELSAAAAQADPRALAAIRDVLQEGD